ncbi:MAG: phosphoribosyl-ATP diphosphatase [Candidatus Hadarchaeales archaeon]
MSAEILEELFEVIEDRKKNPRPGSYTCKLLATGKAGAKVMEEAAELVEAAKKKGKNEIVYEAADLLYHTLVLLAEKDVKLDEVMEELRRRRK